MDVNLTEEQQVESLKKWFKQYGNLLSWGIIIILTLVSGVSYWRHHAEVVREQASEHYIALMDGMGKHEQATVDNKAEILLSQYASSPYATLAAFVLAFEAVENKDLEKAETSLQWVIKNSHQADFQAVARIRLMRLYIAQNKLNEALNYYNEKQANGLLTLMAELKGDILLAQKDEQGARNAYELALTSAPEVGMHGPLLKMKMEDLGMSVPIKEKTQENAAEKEATHA